MEEASNTQRTPYLFTAKELDEETGLYYFGARYYDPRTSVWQSPDPILASYMGGSPNGGVSNPRNLSLYSYAFLHPLNLKDRNGKWALIDDAIAAGGGALIGIAVQAGVDVYNWEMSSWKDYAAAGASGAVTGEVTLYAGPLAGGAAGGATHAFASHGLKGELPSAGEVAVSTGAGVIGGAAGKALEPVAGKAAGWIGSKISGQAETVGSIRGLNAIGGKMNCVNCVIATDATLAGNPASALGGGPFNIGVLERHFGAKFGGDTTINSISETMSNAGNGARGIVFGSRGNEVGHVFNVVNQKGVVRFLDGQTGKAATFDGYDAFRLLRTNE